CAESEHQADKGELIFDKHFAQLLRKAPHSLQAEIRGMVMERLAGGFFHLTHIPETLLRQIELPDLPPLPTLQQDVVAHFLPESLLHFTQHGEFRHVVAIFISFEGIDSLAEFNDWAFVLTDNITRFSGYFNHIDFGDKGGVVICGFGAPVAYEDMVDRALGFIMSVQQELTAFETLSALKLRAGITFGFAYAGIAGGEKRCEYTFYGEVVNLAARFMMQAGWGEIFVSDAIKKKTLQFTFEHKGDISYKGFAEVIPTYRLKSRKAGVRQQMFTSEMVGRREELQQLQQFAAPIFEGKFAGLAYIFGEAGVGKSRLSYAMLEEWSEERDISWFNCPADQILQKPFNPFISFFMRYFEQSPESSEEDNTRRFEERYQALVEAISPHPGPILKELLRTQPVIGAQLGLFWKGSLWEQLDAKGKYNNTIDAIKNFFLAHSLQKPLAIELEDGHWLDSDSRALLETFVRNIDDYPIVLLSTLRYNDDGSKSGFDLHEIDRIEIDLRDLSPEDVKRCAEVELDGKISEELHRMLVEKTKGNPFYVQQMVLYFVENEAIALRD
ncbi:MAG: AAA family ATPase, partial [bacterium]|nr:AAA family ATPase [bacterium]